MLHAHVSSIDLNAARGVRVPAGVAASVDDLCHPVSQVEGSTRKQRPAVASMTVAKKRELCLWCGREVVGTPIGRRRRYCKPSCRQRAYEQRRLLKNTSFPDDAVVLTASELADLADRVFSLRCAAEDVATAVDDGADTAELRPLCATLLELAAQAERWR